MLVITKDLKSEFFNKYGITPMIKKTNGNTTHVYPEITAEKLVQLIAIASSAFRISFAFERGYEDVEENVLESLCNYDDLQGGVKRKVQRLFKV